ncbi:hypothetical protein ACFXDO_18335 [Streptomyces nigra]|uniref:hypothetical protein n=1 Tax=Streptomyces nigra TaxID=1827580 RepID=UPI00369E5A04
MLVSLLDRDLQRFPTQDARHFAEALSAHVPDELNELLQGRVEAARSRSQQARSD